MARFLAQGGAGSIATKQSSGLLVTGRSPQLLMITGHFEIELGIQGSYETAVRT